MRTINDFYLYSDQFYYERFVKLGELSHPEIGQIFLKIRDIKNMPDTEEKYLKIQEINKMTKIPLRSMKVKLTRK